MDGTTPTVSELAVELGVVAKTMRGWMRRQGWRHPVELGSPWMLTAEQVEQLRMHFSSSTATVALAPASTDDDPGFEALTVGELLTTYSRVLAELRLRNVVRTNNAPIGDLAEYCAASVYEWTTHQVREQGRHRTHTNGTVVRVAQVRAASAIGVDRTGEFDATWQALLAQRR